MTRRHTSVFAVIRKVVPLALAAMVISLLAPGAAGASGWIRLLAPNEKGYAVAVALDMDGNMYVCGSTEQIGGDAGNDGDKKMVVTKYGTDARQLWTKYFGDGRRGQCVDISFDSGGNVYAAAFPVDDKGPKAVIARYSPAGEPLGYGEYNMGKAAMVMGVAPDKEGNVYIAGFSASEGVARKEAFIAKYNLAGQQVWRRFVPKLTEARAEGRAIAVGDDSVYITGWISGSGGTAGKTKNAFIAKYSTAGYFGWVKVFGGIGDVEGNSVAIGPQGDLLVAGFTAGDLPGSHGFGGADAFLAQFSKDGKAGWAEMFGTPNHDYGYGAAYDDRGGIYLGGSSSVAVAGKAMGDSFDLFMAHYLPNGVRVAVDAAEMPAKGLGSGLAASIFAGRIMLNTGNRVSIYSTSSEGFIGNEKDGRWSVQRWLVGPEEVTAAKEKPEETAAKEDGKKVEHLASFKMENKSFFARDINEVGYVHNFFGKTVIFTGSALALAGLLLLL